jgi:hypothetical protein
MAATRAVSRGNMSHCGGNIGLLAPRFGFLPKFDRREAET